MERNIYLQTIAIENAVARLTAALNRETLLTPQRLPTQDALGRVTAGPIFARLSAPTFHSAAMDGIAVRARETFAAREGSACWPTSAMQRFTWTNRQRARSRRQHKRVH